MFGKIAGLKTGNVPRIPSAMEPFRITETIEYNTRSDSYLARSFGGIRKPRYFNFTLPYLLVGYSHLYDYIMIL